MGAEAYTQDNLFQRTRRSRLMACPHCRRVLIMIRRLLALAALAAALFAVPATLASPAAHASVTPGSTALNWAEGHALNHWYGWGGTGPAVYDCSGLIYESLGRTAGIWLPRTVAGMLGSRHLVRTYHPQRGDLAVWGTHHIEFVTSWYHTTFGAHHSGLQIGWRSYSAGWAPTSFWRLVY